MSSTSKPAANKRVETEDEWVARHLATAPPLDSTQADLLCRVFRQTRVAADGRRPA